MVNKNCQKCDKKIDTGQEPFIVLDGSMTAEEYRNNQPKKGKIICVDCWEVNKDGELINCCDVVKEIPLSQSSVTGPDGKPFKERRIIRMKGLYSPPKPKAKETDNSNDKKLEKQVVQPGENSNKKLWVGITIGLLVGAVLVGGIIWWLLKKPKEPKGK